MLRHDALERQMDVLMQQIDGLADEHAAGEVPSDLLSDDGASMTSSNLGAMVITSGEPDEYSEAGYAIGPLTDEASMSDVATDALALPYNL